MQISMGHGFKIRLGNYEMDEASTHVTMNHRDLGYTDEEWDVYVSDVGHEEAFGELSNAVRGHLYDTLLGELQAVEPYIVEPEETFVPLWLADHEPVAQKKRGS